MSKINLTPNASGTGVFTIASPNSNTDYTFTLPEVTGGDFIVSDSSGNVTIGGTTPGNAGTVNVSVGSPGSTVGGLQLWSTTSGSHFLQFGDAASGDGYYRGAVGYLHTSDALVAYSAGAERMRIDSSGNVGIGTTSPDRTLSIKGNSSTNIPLTVESGAGQPNCLIAMRDENTTSSYQVAVGADTDDMVFRAGGSERMRLDSSGDLGIGTTSPSTYSNYSTLTLQDTTGGEVDFKNGSGQVVGAIYNTSNALTIASDFSSAIASSAIIFTIDGSERLRLDNNSSLDLVGDFYVGPSNNIIYESGTTFNLRAAVANLTFQTNGANERMRIDSSGNLLVGTTSATVTGAAGFGVLPAGNAAGSPFVFSSSDASVNSQITWAAYSRGASAYRFYVGYGGTIYATSTSITAISDESLKENVRDLDKGLETINALRPRRFDWKNGDGNDIMGFVAQEVEGVLPELVHEYTYSKEETKLGLKMGDMVPSMVKAIQELSAQVNELKAEVAALEAR